MEHAGGGCEVRSDRADNAEHWSGFAWPWSPGRKGYAVFNLSTGRDHRIGPNDQRQIGDHPQPVIRVETGEDLLRCSCRREVLPSPSGRVPDDGLAGPYRASRAPAVDHRSSTSALATSVRSTAAARRSPSPRQGRTASLWRRNERVAKSRVRSSSVRSSTKRAVAAGRARRPFRGGFVLTAYCLDRVAGCLLIVGEGARLPLVTLSRDQPGEGAACLGCFGSQVQTLKPRPEEDTRER